VDWLERLDPEFDNLRGAIRWAQEHDDRLEVELVEATWFFLCLRGFLHEALGYLEQAIDTATNASYLDQSELLYGGAYVALRTGDYAAVGRWGEQRLELGRARGDASVIARSLVSVALAAELHDNDLGRAKTLYGEAAQVARDCGDTRSLGSAVSNLGNIAVSEGDLATARLYYQQGLELNRKLSDAHGEAGSLASLANLALVEGDFVEAAVLLAESMRLASGLGARELIHVCLVSSADVAAQRGEEIRATRLLGAADSLREEIGLFRSPDLFDQEQFMRITGVFDENDPDLVAAQSEGGAMTPEEAVAYALEGLNSPAEQAPSR
jgi:tetratricopeptide (TPR) repeat protein